MSVRRRLTSPTTDAARPRVVLLACAALLLAASTAIAGPLEQQLAQTKAKKRQIHAKLAGIVQSHARLQNEVSSLSDQIARINVPLAGTADQITYLQSLIQHRQAAIVDLKQQFAASKSQIAALDSQRTDAQQRLAEHAVIQYENQSPQLAAVATGATSMQDIVDRQSALTNLDGGLAQIVGMISSTERQTRIARAHNHDLRSQISGDERQLREELAQVTQQQAALEQQRSAVARLRTTRAAALTQLNSQRVDLVKDDDQLDSDETTIRHIIAHGGTFSGAAPPGLTSAGLIWPVNGPISSPFGMRWGRMHEGVDIAVGYGTPIHAAQSGIVTYAGWENGYGNFILIQHAGNLATAYGHQSRLNATVGEVVTQGQIIGFVGCTGHCFGPHLHFETRVNGTAVDPMRYL
jgi:murein DD-endopeptidase MepM/ murein hydrolase activator NlpD